MNAVVEARHVHHLGKTTLQGFVGLIHTLGDRACGVETMTERLQILRQLTTASIVLFGNLITDRPHDDRWMVAVGQHEIL